MSIVIYCHELFNYLIMILSGRRGLDCDIVYTVDCYVIAALSLVMTACSGCSRRLSVVCVYGYGRVPIYMAVDSVSFDSVSL